MRVVFSSHEDHQRALRKMKVVEGAYHMPDLGTGGHNAFLDVPPNILPNRHMNRLGLATTNCFVAGTNCVIDSGDGVTLIGDGLVSGGSDGDARLGDADNQIIVSADGSVSVIGDARKAIEAVKRALLFSLSPAH